MLKDLTVKDFMSDTASDSPAPGGGSIAALSGASAASLISMVASLTIGKKGYEDVQDEMQEIMKTAIEYKDKFVSYIDEDSAAFNGIMAALKMPKGSDEEKNMRREKLQKAFKEATLTPLKIGEDAFKLMPLCEKVIMRGNKNAVSDGAVAAMCARTAVHSAMYNVKINLPSIKDESFAKEMKDRMAAVESEVDSEEKRLLSMVEL